jgi:hypothetical protein
LSAPRGGVVFEGRLAAGADFGGGGEVVDAVGRAFAPVGGEGGGPVRADRGFGGGEGGEKGGPVGGAFFEFEGELGFVGGEGAQFGASLEAPAEEGCEAREARRDLCPRSRRGSGAVKRSIRPR